MALDVGSLEEAVELVDALSSEVEVFKVGISPFIAFGNEILGKLESIGKKVFLDLKIHDIPNTVSNAARASVKKNVHMMNFHCLGGSSMLKAAVKGVRESSASPAPILLGVTILTSMGEEDMRGLGLSGSVEDKVIELARMAAGAGLDGVVASAKEARRIKKEIGKDFLVVTPGVRPEWAAAGDQKRVLTPGEAIKEGADYIVVGRPVIQAADPLAAAGKIIDEIGECF